MRTSPRARRRALRVVRLALATSLTVGLAACTPNSNGAAETTRTPAPSTPSSSSAPTGAAFTHATIAKDAMAGAKAGLTALGTYSYKHFDTDVKAVEADLTPSYSAKYAAKTADLKDTVSRLKNTSSVSAVVVGLAAVDLGLESATALAQFTQTLTGITVPRKHVVKVVALVGLVEINQKLLINSLAIPPAGPPAAGTPTLGSPELITALAAGESEVTTLGTLSKKHFDSDYKKWLAIATGDLKKHLTKAEKGTKTAFSHTNVALTSACKAAAVESAGATKVELLVFVTATGRHTTSSLSRLTLENVKGHWLAEGLTAL